MYFISNANTQEALDISAFLASRFCDQPICRGRQFARRAGNLSQFRAKLKRTISQIAEKINTVFQICNAMTFICIELRLSSQKQMMQWLESHNLYCETKMRNIK